MPTASNPFRVHGIAEDEYFTDRADEVARIARTLTEPGAKLLVYGPRRMGKTSALARAVARVREQGHLACIADLSTASTVADMGNRVMAAAARVLGRDWGDFADALARGLRASLVFTPDHATGIVTPSFELSLRAVAVEVQRERFGEVLDAIDALAARRRRTVGLVLDEFQEIERFGGEAAEWHLRGVLQRHQHLAYVLAGSQPALIRRMLSEGQAFYGLLDQLQFGPMDPAHLAAWIDERMTTHGVAARGVGARAIALAGPRTRDVVVVARRAYELARLRGEAEAADADAALAEVAAEQDDLLRAQWEELTPLQQNVLRAVAMDAGGLTTRDTLQRFALPSSGSAANAAVALIDAGRLVRDAATATGHAFENPFFREWVRRRTLRDLGPAVLP